MPSCKVISSEEISWTLNECKKYDNGKNINISRYRIKVVLWQHSMQHGFYIFKGCLD